MSGYPRAHSGTTILHQPRTVLLPVAWILRCALAVILLGAFLTFIAAMYGWRDGYSQGYLAGKQSKQLREFNSPKEKTTP